MGGLSEEVEGLERGEVYFSLLAPVCQLCGQLGAFVTTSAGCQDSGWPVGGKLRPKKPLGDSASHACLPLTAGQENWPSVVLVFDPGVRRRVYGGEGGQLGLAE